MSYNLTPCVNEMKLNIDKNADCDENIIHGCILGKGSFGIVCYVDPKQCNPPIENLTPLALKYIYDKDKKSINSAIIKLGKKYDQSGIRTHALADQRLKLAP